MIIGYGPTDGAPSRDVGDDVARVIYRRWEVNHLLGVDVSIAISIINPRNDRATKPIAHNLRIRLTIYCGAKDDPPVNIPRGVNPPRVDVIITPTSSILPCYDRTAEPVACELRCSLFICHSADGGPVSSPQDAPLGVDTLSVDVIINPSYPLLPGDDRASNPIADKLWCFVCIHSGVDDDPASTPPDIPRGVDPLGMEVIKTPIYPVLPSDDCAIGLIADKLKLRLVICRNADRSSIGTP
ncbi:MAG: hypothetical protein RBG13Loki_4186 [Promethearchaeota archaeon CR_4]|nr:MAG: hypothetical protein RBG13Loki_4186 [Candidatus Lokiarchaeota archaeon CR_4]